MSQFNIDQLVNELARRARIGNSLSYHHARARMDLRHSDLDVRVRLSFMRAQRAAAANGTTTGAQR